VRKYLKSLKTTSRKTSRGKVEWGRDMALESRVKRLVKQLDLDWVKTSQIYCFKSEFSKTRAYARIWGLSRIWQLALKERPKYIIEVITERFNKLKKLDQDKVLLHELAHIPKNFSGSLLPHIRKKGKRNFEDRVKVLVAQHKRKML